MLSDAGLCFLFACLVYLFIVVAETGAAAALGHMDVDTSEAGEGWGDEDIIIDEGLVAAFTKHTVHNFF